MRLLEPIARRLARRTDGPVLFSFNGGAGLPAGAGTELYAHEPHFREAVERACPIVEEATGYDARPAFTHAAAPATKVEDLVLHGLIQLGQCALWRGAGVEPDAVLGLSLGEACAVHAAGGLTFEDTTRVICAVADGSSEGRAPHVLFVVQAGRDDAERLCRTAPVPMVLSSTIGPHDAALLCVAADADEGRRHIERSHLVRHEGMSHRATHTPLAHTVRPKMARRLAGIAPSQADLPCFLASAGRDVRSDGRFDARHWSWMHDHQIRFDEALEAALAIEPAIVVQIGSSPHTGPYLEAGARARGRDVAIVNTVQHGEPELDGWRRARGAVPPRTRPRPAAADRAVVAAELDLYDPGFARDPWPVLAELRRQGPVHHLPRSGLWAVVEPDLIREVLSRPHEFSTRLWRDDLDFVLLGAEPVEHRAARRLVTPLLSPQAVQPLAAHADAAAREILGDLRGAQELDVVNALAVPVVHRAIARLLELDEEEVLRCGLGAEQGIDPPLRRSEAAFGGLGSPAGIRERIPLGEAERTSLVKLLWFAGTVTTVRHIGWAVVELGRAPHLRERLTRDPAAMDDFLDEMLRVHPPEPFVLRVTTGPVRLAGRTIPGSATVAAAIGLANRDHARFEDPDSVLIERRPKGLCTFGSGAHRCPGERLSRILAASTIGALLDVLPRWELVQPDHALRVPADRLAHGLAELFIAPVG